MGLGGDVGGGGGVGGRGGDRVVVEEGLLGVLRRGDLVGRRRGRLQLLRVVVVVAEVWRHHLLLKMDLITIKLLSKFELIDFRSHEFNFWLHPALMFVMS